MSDLDADGSREFKDLDAHATQVALAEEFMTDTDEESVSEEEGAADAEQPTDAVDGNEGSEVHQPEWSDEEIAEHTRMVEALLFAAAEPLDQRTLEGRLPAGADIDTIIDQLSQDYASRGVNLQKIDKKWRFVTASDVAHVLEKEQIAPRRLSRAALETLAIIAYHQPCTRADIEDVRGVAVSKGSLDQLLEIGWVRMRGKRRDVPGRPTLYGTSDEFLEHFGLETVTDLPGIADLKAAGLLDARLPPGFSVPSPVDGDELDDGGDESENDDFVQDFHESADDADPEAVET